MECINRFTSLSTPRPNSSKFSLACKRLSARKLIDACHAYIEFHQAKPKPLKWKKGDGSRKRHRKRHAAWKKAYLALERRLKAALTGNGKGWPGRLANAVTSRDILGES